MLDSLTPSSPTGATFTLTSDTTVQATLVSPTKLKSSHIVLQIDVGSGVFKNTSINLSNEPMQRLSLQVGTYRWYFSSNSPNSLATVHTTFEVQA